MPVLAEYVGSYPEVCLDVRYSERFVNLVEEGVELAVRIGKLEASTLVARRLGNCRVLWLRRRNIFAITRRRNAR